MLSLVVPILMALGIVLVRRIFAGPARPTWSFSFEVFVEFLRQNLRRQRLLSPVELRLFWERMSVYEPVVRLVRFRKLVVSGVDAELCETRVKTETPIAQAEQQTQPETLESQPEPPQPVEPQPEAPESQDPQQPERLSVPGSLLLYLHGGSYHYGSTNTHRALIAQLTLGAGTTTLALNYRLAPEHPYPAALEDALAAYEWILGQGIPASKIRVAGDSAGGGLALALLLALRKAGRPLPEGVLLFSPWVDLAARGGSLRRNQVADWLQEQDFLTWAQGYLAGADPKTPGASPIHGELSGLPPIHCQIGGAELLLDQVEDLARRAKEARVRFDLRYYPDMIHSFQMFWSFLPMGRAALLEALRFLRDLDQPKS